MNKEVHESCNFPEAIHIVRPLWCFLKISKNVPHHMLKYNDTIHDFLEKSLLKQTARR
jgi:hypothetical protein